MSQLHRLQERRFELKYQVPEALTPSLRSFISGYLELDDYGAAHPSRSYPVHSVYLDSDDLKTCQDAVNGTRNRFKLRLRYYDDQPGAPVFCEIKARSDNCILKRRCGIRRAALPVVLAGQIPEPELFYSTEPRHLAALQRFTQLLTQFNAEPKAHNCYRREAWVSPDYGSVRVTFDRDVMIEPCFDARTRLAMDRPRKVFPGFVVLEMKFTSRFPEWLAVMVQRFNLMQCSSAKYVEGVEVLGHHQFNSKSRRARQLLDQDLALAQKSLTTGVQHVA